MINTSITDLPRNAKNGEKDNFGIEPFEKGLIKFIKDTSTPITIALQGEWGSGKTSLMNSLKEKLCSKPDSKYHDIWLNTWEHALMKDAETTLIEIISGLIEEVSKKSNVEQEKRDKLLKNVRKIGFSALKVASSFHSLTKEAFDEAQNYLSQEKATTIGEIRTELDLIIENCVKKDNKKGFIFFIDDLDRIDPPVAVELLELLKNIFTLNNCVFILAIDYDVVVKGLEPKFGKLTASNEREFRSFFDKIIQVPFSMPVSSYSSDTFLQESLRLIDYLNDQQANNNDLITKFSEISNLTVGSNPRALKRLLNSISLIGCINSAKEQTYEEDQLNDDTELLINFALVSIQIAYPAVYRMLNKHPAFNEWNENIALQYNLKELDEHSKQKLDSMEEFDEEWEKVLFRLCENDYYLKKKALNISVLLNLLKKYITEKEENIEDTIKSIISLSSVTNIDSEETSVKEIEYHRGHFLKHLRNLLIPKLKEKLPEQSQFIAPKGRRVQTNAFLAFTQDQNFKWLKITSHPYEGQIRLLLLFSKYMCKIDTHNNIEDAMNSLGYINELKKMESEYNSLSEKFEGITQTKFLEYISRNEGCFNIDIYSYLIKPSIEDFYKDETIELLSSAIAEKYKTISAMAELSHKIFEGYKK